MPKTKSKKKKRRSDASSTVKPPLPAGAVVKDDAKSDVIVIDVDSCRICLDDIEQRGTIDSCDHAYCFECIDAWSRTQNTCPTCRVRFRRIVKDDGTARVIADDVNQRPDNPPPTAEFDAEEMASIEALLTSNPMASQVTQLAFQVEQRMREVHEQRERELSNLSFLRAATASSSEDRATARRRMHEAAGAYLEAVRAYNALREAASARASDDDTVLLEGRLIAQLDDGTVRVAVPRAALRPSAPPPLPPPPLGSGVEARAPARGEFGDYVRTLAGNERTARIARSTAIRNMGGY